MRPNARPTAGHVPSLLPGRLHHRWTQLHPQIPPVFLRVRIGSLRLRRRGTRRHSGLLQRNHLRLFAPSQWPREAIQRSVHPRSNVAVHSGHGDLHLLLLHPRVLSTGEWSPKAPNNPSLSIIHTAVLLRVRASNSGHQFVRICTPPIDCLIDCAFR